MSRVKDIRLKIIPSQVANDFVKKHHYSHNYVRNSRLHFGAFLDDKLHGVLSYGSPMNKYKTIGLVANTKWNEFIELNRMAFDNYLPKYSESRCIAVSIRLIKKNAPQIKWILSFADGIQCGDGTIYRAAGFHLTQIKKNTGIFRELITGKTFVKAYGEQYRMNKGIIRGDAEKLHGFMLRYIYLIDKSLSISVPIIPFSKIDEMGAGIYKGKNITLAERKMRA